MLWCVSREVRGGVCMVGKMYLVRWLTITIVSMCVILHPFLIQTQEVPAIL